MRFWTAITLVLCAAPAFADNWETPGELPPTVTARQWIEQDPAVREARSALLASGHAAAMLKVSPNEWISRVAAQRRSFDSGGSDSNEWQVQLERSIRIGGKSGIDRQLGETELAIAQARVGEAIHESARLLLDLWIDGLAATQADKLLNEQLSFAQTNLRAVERRKKAGDASALDVNVAAADLADVERQVSLASTNHAKAQAKLRVRFPGAQLPTRPLGNPQALAESESQWLQRVLEAADPMNIAKGQLRKAELSAARASADRLPDPTLGIFAASEAFHRERIVGISISVPLGGTYRNERMRQTLQEVEVARAGLERLRRELEVEVAANYADATGNLARWRMAEQGAMTTGESARLTQRAYTLGEADMQSLLLARRQFLDASRAALDARADALRASYRLLIDAHLIWDLALE